MEVKTLAREMDALCSKGEMVAAVKKFYSDDASSADYGGVATKSKDEMVAKMEGFLAAIETVKGITHHNTIADGNLSASEFTFDFDMKDESKVYWHEIIRRKWKDGKVIQEEYFNAD